MPTTQNWIEALGSIKKLFHIPKNTEETYNKIRSMGLDTIEYHAIKQGELISKFQDIYDFLESNKPCLFIYEPTGKISSLKKEFLFGVEDIKEIFSWIKGNQKDIYDYKYIITTQIQDYERSFVGTAMSNGKGKMLIETLHRPGICNHRELSHGKCNSAEVSEIFIDIGHDEWWSAKNPLLKRDLAEKIISSYADRKGYFEFVHGVHKGIMGTYTTGYETSGIFRFDEALHESWMMSSKERLIGASYRTT